jgi:hypothetical protein
MGTKYLPMRKMLLDAADRGAQEITSTFDELDRLIPGGLPSSARRHRAWWSNSGQPHSEVWRGAGWLVDGVDQFGRGWVRFRQAGAGRWTGATPAAEGFIVAPRLPSLNVSSSGAPAAGASVESSEIRAGNTKRQTDLRLHFHWVEAGPITLDMPGRLQFPAMPSRPGIYRITRLGRPGQTRPRVYVGEADVLSRRMAGYRTPGPSQTTNIWMNEALVTHLRAGGTAVIDIAVSAFVMVGEGEGPLAPLGLGSKSARQLAEAAELVAARASGEVDLDNRCEYDTSSDPLRAA